MDSNASIISSNTNEPCRRLDFESETIDEVHETINDIHARIPKELVPVIGMEFDSLENAFNFYLAYSKEDGFSIRLSTKHDDKCTGVTLDREFCCARAGENPKDRRDPNVTMPRALTRCNCLAKMKVSCRKEVKYRIVKFVASHNHNCATPSKTHLFPSHRTMTVAQKNEVDASLSCGISQRETMGLLSKQAGGRENIGFIEVDCKTYLRSKRKNMQVGETRGVLEYLEEKRNADPNFSYFLQLDEDDLITNIFWVDSRMKSDYSHFGDVVCYDTTYRKHKDGRPIAMFVGVNNHKQSILFGAALLYDETAETFSWLFDSFTTTMSGKKPQTMLTDQNTVMSKALASQWPTTYHRICVWHINKNASIHLKHIIAKQDNLLRAFSSCMYDHDEEDDFINAWLKMLKDYDLQDNQWLEGLYRIRKKWALVYGRETFCVGMSTTQRSESMNSVIKKYVSYKNELSEFFGHFDRLLKNQRYKVSRANFSTDQSVPYLKLPVQILKHGANVYTQEAFKMFQGSVCKSYDCKIKVLGESESITQYEVGALQKQHYHRVSYNSIDDTVTCGCKRFKFVGILCSHALKVLNHREIIWIPNKYVMKRWTKSARWQNIRVGSQDLNLLDPKETMSYYYRDLWKFSTQLVNRAAESKKTYEIAMQGLHNLFEEIDASFEDDGDETHVDGLNSVPVESDNSEACREINGRKIAGIKPKEKITYKTSKRIRSGLEIARKRKKSKKQDPNHVEQGPSYEEPQSQDCGSYYVTPPYSNENLHLNQNSSWSFEQVQAGKDSTMFSGFNFTSTSNYGSEGILSNLNLLKMVDPTLNEQSDFPNTQEYQYPGGNNSNS